MACDGGDGVAGDANGDSIVDVRDLQVLVVKVLAGVERLGVGDLNGDSRVNVLDFQQALAQVHRPERHSTTPRARIACRGCFFHYQKGWVAEPTPRKLEPACLILPPSTMQEPLEHPIRIVIATTSNRYLFRITPNAPPLFA